VCGPWRITLLLIALRLRYAPYCATASTQMTHQQMVAQVMAVGLNAIREVCARCPLIMEQDLLSDLVQVSVTAAAQLIVMCSCPIYDML